MTISPDFVGIDVSKSTLDIFDAAIGRVERIDNASVPLAALMARWRGRKLFVLFEATGRYDRLLRGALEEAAIAFARVNPQRARDFARAAGFLAKTDAVDARMLAMMAERLRPRSEPKTQPWRERLAALHRRREQLVRMRAQERTRLSDADQGEEHDDVQSHIVWLSAQIKVFDARIRALIAEDRKTADLAARLRTAPGIGPVAAATLLALLPELGDRSAKTIAALAGLAPINRDSGTMRGKRSICGGRKPVRDALFIAALAAKRFSPHYAAIYKAFIAAGKAKKLAIVAIARKLLVALNAMVKNNADFKPA
jgi:transposase